MSFVMENGGSAEVALIGREGMVGVRLLLGDTALNVRASVQGAGSGLRLPADCLLDEVGRGGALMQVLLHYTSTYIGQIVQTAACNRHGSVEQRLCRWLLLNLDRVSSSELTMTHEAIADALGVKREGITEAAGRLRRLGAIQYQRGHIDVLDRAILESRTGEFYRPGPRKTERGVVGVH
jgi:CRP-like cAMP-binding protein